LLDLEFGLPVQVRDTQVGGEAQTIPYSDVNREYLADQAERDVGEGALPWHNRERMVNETLRKLARTEPYYKRNRAHICSFFLRGTCSRGNNCPYRHEMPEDNGDLAQQNIKDRYYGVNDPVAKKLLSKADEIPVLSPPEDPNITTLYVGGLTSNITEEDIRGAFYGYGEIVGLKLVANKRCAFVTYRQRVEADRAATALFNKLVIKGTPLKISYGKPQDQVPVTPTLSYMPPPPPAALGIPPPPSIIGMPAPSGMPGMAPPGMPPAGMPPAGIPPPPGLNYGGPVVGVPPPPGLSYAQPPPSYQPAQQYPSMDPSMMGSRPDTGKTDE